MDIATLQKFCSTSERHAEYGIDEPFSCGDWTYATDGCICIRIPIVPGVIGKAKASIIASAAVLFSGAHSRVAPVYQPLPEFKLEYGNCSTCGGTGYRHECPLSGSEKCVDGGNEDLCIDYDDECMRGCNRAIKGAVECEDCEGQGVIKLQGKYIVKGSAGTTQISAIYLDMIKDLPSVQIAPYDETSAFLIQFDDGEGVLMPMKQ